MGSRHNRKRTRSRPRNRLASRSSTFTYESLPVHSSPAAPSFPIRQPPAQHWQQQYDAWQARQHLQRHDSFAPPGLSKRATTLSIASTPSCISSEDTLDARRIHMFGGSEDDEESLCAPMLQVVLDLFDGRIDYDDR